MAIDFTHIPKYDAADFLGEFPASQVPPLVDAFNELADRFNGLLDAIYVSGTGLYVKEKASATP